jgi:mono/diheme cytochrome c family protein
MFAATVLFFGCTFTKNMYEQPKYLPLQPSKLFPDGRSASPPVEGTVALGNLHVDEVYSTGMTASGPVDTLPVPLTKTLLLHGQERFNIYCSPCHDRTGSGRGMIVLRGFAEPPSYHIPRLRNAPIGHFFNVMSHGFGQMPDYASQVPVADRWAIASYIRTLQFSEHTSLADLPAAERRKLENSR